MTIRIVGLVCLSGNLGRLLRIITNDVQSYCSRITDVFYKICKQIHLMVVGKYKVQEYIYSEDGSYNCVGLNFDLLSVECD